MDLLEELETDISGSISYLLYLQQEPNSCLDAAALENLIDRLIHEHLLISRLIKVREKEWTRD